MVSCDVRDIGMWLEKVEPWGRDQVHEGDRFRGSSQWGIGIGEY